MDLVIEKLSAFEFLTNEKKSINLDVTDYLDSRKLYNYGYNRSGSESISTVLELEYDLFQFEVKINISFDFESTHEAQCFDNPEYKDIEFENIQAEFEILNCYALNFETEDYEDYMISDFERNKIINYLSNNLTLTD